MNRRNFLKYASSLGLVLCTPGKFALSQESEAIEQFFIFIDAGGGWDPTSLCDPKGNIERSDGRGVINHYHADDIETLANSPIQYAPFPNTTLLNSESPALREDMPITSFTSFFNRHSQKITIINGIDVETVSHAVGSRNTWSGSSKEGTPSLSALVAANKAPDSIMSFLSYGGYDTTANLVPVTRVNNPSIFQELAFTNRPNINDSNRHYLHPSVYQKITQAKQQRLQRALNESLLPQRRAALRRLLNIQSHGLEHVITKMDFIKNHLPNQNFSKGLKGQAELASAAFAAGAAVSANLYMGGLDTHSSHDRNHTFNLAELIDGVDHLWDMLERLNIANKTTVIIGSDFGRTPFYNEQFGKDHWNITSMILMSNRIPGNRVIGGTDENYNALKLNPINLEIAQNQDDPFAIKLSPSHIHTALRQKFHIKAANFSLEAPLLPIFG